MQKIKCIIVDDEPVARDILQLLLKQIMGIEVLEYCKNALEAMTALEKHTVDLIFLDINMPDISGLALAQSLPKSTKIIFTTAYREYAIDGFDLQAVDYLLKPISLDRLRQAILKYRSENTTSPDSNYSNRDYLIVRSDRKMVKVNWDDILYIESLSDYVKLHTPSKMILTRDTISNIETKLPSKLFIRIHRSFIVSVSHISGYTNEYVEIGNKQLTISRSYRSFFLEKIEGN